jgi:hypothetical protein
MNKILDFLGSNIIKTVGDIVDDLHTSDEEEQQLELKKRTLANNYDLEKRKLSYEDTKNSRLMNSDIQKSKHSSTLAKNSAYILDFLIIIGFLFSLYVLLFIEIPSMNEKIIYLVIGSLGTLATQIIQFHRGSSQGSKDKSNLQNQS